MFKNRKDLVSTSSLGGKKQQINFACHFQKKYSKRKRKFIKNVISLVKLFSCHAGNQVFTNHVYFFSSLNIVIQRKKTVPGSLFE